MCEAAKNNGRGSEIQEAFPRPRLLLEAVFLSDGCVEGLKAAGLQIDEFDYNTTLAELTARRKDVEARYEYALKNGGVWARGHVATAHRWLDLAVERLDGWRQA